MLRPAGKQDVGDRCLAPFEVLVDGMEGIDRFRERVLAQGTLLRRIEKVTRVPRGQMVQIMELAGRARGAWWECKQLFAELGNHPQMAELFISYRAYLSPLRRIVRLAERLKAVQRLGHFQQCSFYVAPGSGSGNKVLCDPRGCVVKLMVGPQHTLAAIDELASLVPLVGVVPLGRRAIESLESVRVAHMSSAEEVLRSVRQRDGSYSVPVPGDSEPLYRQAEVQPWLVRKRTEILQLPFAHLHYLYCKREINDKTRVAPDGGIWGEGPPKFLQLGGVGMGPCLNQPWETRHPLPLLVPGVPYTLASIRPYISPLIDGVRLSDKLCKTILGRLSVDSLASCEILVGECGMYDLHQGNVFFAPAPSDALELMRGSRFTYETKDGSKRYDAELRLLLEDFLLGQINGDTRLGIDREWEGKLEEQVDLLAVCEGAWEVQFLDLERMFPESNLLHKVGKSQGAVPFRSVFLRWFDNRPYDEGVLLRLREWDERFPEFMRWVMRWDSPCRKGLDEAVQQRVDDVLILLCKDHRGMNGYNEEYFLIRTAGMEVKREIWDLLNMTDATPEQKMSAARTLFPRLSPRQIEALKERMEWRRQYLDAADGPITHCSLAAARFPLLGLQVEFLERAGWSREDALDDVGSHLVDLPSRILRELKGKEDPDLEALGRRIYQEMGLVFPEPEPEAEPAERRQKSDYQDLGDVEFFG